MPKKVALLNHRPRAIVAVFGLLIAVSVSLVLAQRPQEDQELNFEVERRINAHGDEFNGLAKSSDGKRLFTATEKGEIIVWNTAANRVERTLQQPSALHLIASLGGPREFVAVGYNHFKPIKALARKWNADTGEFVDLSGLDPNTTPIALATETVSGLIALTTQEGKVLVWDAQTNKQLGDWKLDAVPSAVAVLGRDVYVATVDQEYVTSGQGPQTNTILKLNVDRPQQAPAEFLRVEGRAWIDLGASPDYRLLRATYYASGQRHKIAVIDPESKREMGNFEAGASLWISNDRLMLFEWLDPTEIVQISSKGPAKSLRKFERLESDTPGRAFDLTGQVSNADGSKAWASYRQGPGLLEFDLAAKKIKTLIGGPSGAYALSVLSDDGKTGEVLTGGADGYVRLWKLSDLSLLKEYKVAGPNYFVKDALLVPGSRRAVFGTLRMDWMKEPSPDQVPVTVTVLDLETGQQKKLFDAFTVRTPIELIDNHLVFAELGSIKFVTLDGVKTKRELKLGEAIARMAVSANGHWLAVVGYSNKLTVFDLKTDQRQTMTIDEEYNGPIVITNDGKYVYRIGLEGSLTMWDISTSQTTTHTLTRVREMHSRVDFITLAHDDRWLVVAGNHRDVGIFDRATLRMLFYTQTAGAAWYVEGVWIGGDRMINTTDTGVMYSGVLK